MIRKVKRKINIFLKDPVISPIHAAIAAGVYPLLYFYNSNFILINSWGQFVFIFSIYILSPILIFYLLKRITRKLDQKNNYVKYLIPALNSVWFVFLIILSTYGLKKKLLLLSMIISFCIGALLYKHIKKIIIFQHLLSIIVLFKLIPFLYDYMTSSNKWMEQPDTISQVTFKKRPNIYIIQPDGYANFSELKKGYYNFNNEKFERYLTNNGFKLYADFRSNYTNTLTSNSSMFSMKHHYYIQPKKNNTLMRNWRNIIAGDNPVISIFKKNNYTTSLLLEKPYLVVNRPTLYYDHCNMDYKEIPILSRGFDFFKDVYSNLNQAIETNTSTANFYFIEKMSPTHITVRELNSKGRDKEREKYIEDIQLTNEWLSRTIDLIIEKDPNSLIVIVADHGGYVGLNSTSERQKILTDDYLVKSIFTSALAIKWPSEAPEFDNKLKSNVNLFRILFAYLSENEAYLEHLQEDISYLIIREDSPFGVYQAIDANGNMEYKIKD